MQRREEVIAMATGGCSRAVSPPLACGVWRTSGTATGVARFPCLPRRPRSLIAVNILQGYADRGGGTQRFTVTALSIVVAVSAICVERRRRSGVEAMIVVPTISHVRRRERRKPGRCSDYAERQAG